MNRFVIDFEFEFVVFIDFENPNPMMIRFPKRGGIYNPIIIHIWGESNWKHLEGWCVQETNWKGMRCTCRVINGFNLTWRRVNFGWTWTTLSTRFFD